MRPSWTTVATWVPSERCMVAVMRARAALATGLMLV
jgi:hypothetical protein